MIIKTTLNLRVKRRFGSQWDFKKTPWFGDNSGEAVNKGLKET